MPMNAARAFFLSATLMLGAVLLAAPAAQAEAAATTAGVSAAQVRAQWASARQAYLDGIAPYVKQAQHSALLQEYTAALDDTGKSLEAFIALKLAKPAVAPSVMTPAVDQLTNHLMRLKTLQGKAKGNLISVLGGALKQQQQITQNAIKNMR